MAFRTCPQRKVTQRLGYQQRARQITLDQLRYFELSLFQHAQASSVIIAMRCDQTLSIKPAPAFFGRSPIPDRDILSRD